MNKDKNFLNSSEPVLSPLKATPTQAVTCQVPAGETGATGQTGTTGASAYEVAVNNGFVGTETKWLNSLVGSTGLAGVSQSIIPYFVSNFEGYSYDENDAMVHTLTVLGFGNYEYGIKPNEYGPPQSFTIDMEEDVLAAAFLSAYDYTIKSIAFSSFGGGELSDFEVEINVAIFMSPVGSSVFTVEPTSVLTLSPPVSTSTTIFNVDGSKDLNIFVPAGTKVAVAAYTTTVQPMLEFYDLLSYLSGSISIETN